jgi:hypothetical protein
MHPQGVRTIANAYSKGCPVRVLSSPVRASRPTVTRLVALALVGALAGLGSVSLAAGQDSGSRTTHEREGRGRREKSRHGRGDAPPEKAAEEHAPEASADAEPDAPEGTDAASDTRGSYIESGGEKVKVLEFTGLDVSGRLKSPQLLYFLNRVRAEFDRPRLPHRSFIGEMERSSHDKSF